MGFLLHLPPPVSFFIVSAVTTFFGLFGLYLVRRKYSAEVLKENHEVAAIIFNAFGLFYGVLVAFGVFAVSYTFFFGMKNIRAQYLITTTLTVMLTSILFLIYVLDHPFTGTSRVSLAPLRQAMTTMQEE